MRLYRFCVRGRPFFSPFLGWREGLAVGRRSYRGGWLFHRPLLPMKARDCPRIGIRSKIDTTTSSLRFGGVENEGRMLKVTWADGQTTAFHAVWLRHNCQCPSCITSSNQKAIDPAILHPDITVRLNESSGGSS